MIVIVIIIFSISISMTVLLYCLTLFLYCFAGSLRLADGLQGGSEGAEGETRALSASL